MQDYSLHEKCPNMELFLVHIFLYQSEYRKIGPEITLYLDTFHTMIGPSLAGSLECLTHHQNKASLSLFYRYYFGRCSSELAQLVTLPFLEVGLLVILIDCMILGLKANYGRKVLDSRCPMCHSEKDTTEYVVEYNKEDKKTIFNDE